MRLALNGQVRSHGVYATFYGKAVNSIPLTFYGAGSGSFLRLRDRVVEHFELRLQERSVR